MSYLLLCTGEKTIERITSYHNVNGNYGLMLKTEGLASCDYVTTFQVERSLTMTTSYLICSFSNNKLFSMKTKESSCFVLRNDGNGRLIYEQMEQKAVPIPKINPGHIPGSPRVGIS